MSDASETLRRAAKVLREHAEAATDGPWLAEHRGYEVYEAKSDHGDVVAEAGLSPSDAVYISVMQPSVGLALADWLENTAAWIDEGLGWTPEIDRTNWRAAWSDATMHALTVARAILREAPDA